MGENCFGTLPADSVHGYQCFEPSACDVYLHIITTLSGFLSLGSAVGGLSQLFRGPSGRVCHTDYLVVWVSNIYCSPASRRGIATVVQGAIGTCLSHRLSSSLGLQYLLQSGQPSVDCNSCSGGHRGVSVSQII